MYLAFTVACFFSPTITVKYGAIRSLSLGITGYIIFVVAGLGVLVGSFKQSKLVGDDIMEEAALVIGGLCCGVGAAILWTAQGQLQLQYSTETTRGRLFAVFWGLFNSGHIIGGALSWTLFSTSLGTQVGTQALYGVFLTLLVVSMCLPRALTPPGECDDTGSQGDEDEDQSHKSNSSWHAELAQTLQVFRSPAMCRLAILFWYTGFNQPYQLQTFTRNFSQSATGAEMMIFYFGEVLGPILTGRVLDNVDFASRRSFVLGMISVTTLSSFLVAAAVEYSNSGSHVVERNLGDPEIFWPTVAFGIWGLADSSVQAFAYWILGGVATEPAERARCVGFY